MTAAWSITIVATLLGVTTLVLAYLLWNARRAARTAAQGRAQYEAELARVNLEYEQFVYVASHDMQEPLRAIEGFGQLLASRHNEALNTEAQEFLGLVLQGTARMRAMVLGVLEYSRAGTGELHLGALQTDSLLNETLSSLREQPEFNGVEVSHDALPEIVADNRQLRRLFEHLLLNAAQCAKPEAPATIHIGVERQGSEWLLTVANTSVDIPANKLEQVFEPFTRLAGARGVGMDLAICRRIVARHNGKIWAESASGAGSKIRFTLPG